MKQTTQRPRFQLVTAFITALGKKSMESKKQNKNNNNRETNSEFKYAGLGTFFGAPVYSPKRTKFKGYMRDKSYKAKHI